MRIDVPPDYIAYLQRNGPFEGFVDGDAGYVELWALNAIDGENLAIQINTDAPGFLAFAGNGGGEVFAFDANGAVFMLPLIGMEPQYAVRIANNFAEFSARFRDGV